LDLYCQRCGEPFDQYGVYNGDMTPEEKTLFLQGKECPSCHGMEMCVLKTPCTACEHALESFSGAYGCGIHQFKRPFRAELASVLGDLLGDDTDGLASEMEDAEYMMGLKFWE
jgi:hypothetical protein